MDSDKTAVSGGQAKAKAGVLVGKAVRVRATNPDPRYFTDLHRQYIGKMGRVHAIVASMPRDNPLVKVGFEQGTQIVFFRLAELEVNESVECETPRKHGERASHLPKT